MTEKSGKAEESGSSSGGSASSGKEGKSHKMKMVRDSFTMPDHEYVQFDVLKKRCLKHGVAAKKSELIRAGLILLAGLSDSKLVDVIDQVEKLKTGRPSKA